MIGKFAKRCSGPYVVKETYDNATYLMWELDGIELKVPIAGKQINFFQRRNKDHEDGNKIVQEDEEYDSFDHKGN